MTRLDRLRIPSALYSLSVIAAVIAAHAPQVRVRQLVGALRLVLLAAWIGLRAARSARAGGSGQTRPGAVWFAVALAVLACGWYLLLGSGRAAAGALVCLVLAAIGLTVAYLRAGAWTSIRRQPSRATGALVVPALIIIVCIWGLAVEIPKARAPMPRGCVDTCWGNGLVVIAIGFVLIEMLLLLAVVTAGVAQRAAAAGVAVLVVGVHFLVAADPDFAHPAGLSAILLIGAGAPVAGLPWRAARPAA